MWLIYQLSLEDSLEEHLISAESFMIPYYVCLVVLQRFSSFNVSAIHVFKDCTGNHYLVRQVCPYKMFPKENRNIFLLLKDYSVF